MCVRACVRACVRVCVSACMHACMYTYIHIGLLRFLAVNYVISRMSMISLLYEYAVKLRMSINTLLRI